MRCFAADNNGKVMKIRRPYLRDTVITFVEQEAKVSGADLFDFGLGILASYIREWSLLIDKVKEKESWKELEKFPMEELIDILKNAQDPDILYVAALMCFMRWGLDWSTLGPTAPQRMVEILTGRDVENMKLG